MKFWGGSSHRAKHHERVRFASPGITVFRRKSRPNRRESSMESASFDTCLQTLTKEILLPFLRCAMEYDNYRNLHESYVQGVPHTEQEVFPGRESGVMIF